MMVRGSRLPMGCAVLFFLIAGHSPAKAWDAALTHAGLTQEAISVSRADLVLKTRLGRALGLWETLQLSPDKQRGHHKLLLNRFAALDSSGGYRPGKDGMQAALAWVVAGSVLAKTPPERARNHFFDPRTRKGLADDVGLSGFFHSLALTLNDGTSMRDLATGATFDLQGQSALEWLMSKENDLGLAAFWEHLELSVASASPSERESALVRSLMALGGVLSLLEDMGQPAFVRNDLRGEFLASDGGSAFESYVLRRYGRVALPKPLKPVARPTVESYFVASDGKGLAQLTQDGFFSGGTLPKPVDIGGGRKLPRILQEVNESVPFPEPAITSLDLSVGEKGRYLFKEGRRLCGYRRMGDKLSFFLDDSVFQDSAAKLIPLVEAYAAGLVDHLFRGVVEISAKGGESLVKVSAAPGAMGNPGQLTVFWESQQGTRAVLLSQVVPLNTQVRIRLPVGARKVAAVWKGTDSAGSLLAVGEYSVPDEAFPAKNN